MSLPCISMQWKRALDPQSDMNSGAYETMEKFKKYQKMISIFRKDLYQIVNVPKKTIIVKPKKEWLKDMCWRVKDLMYSCTVLRFAMQLYYNDFMKCAILCIDINIAYEQNQRTLFLISCSFTRKKIHNFPSCDKQGTWNRTICQLSIRLDWI